MASRKFECPYCAAVCELGDPLPARKIKCPSCKMLFQSSDAIAIVKQQTPTARTPAPSPKTGLELPVSLDKAALGIKPAAKSESKWKTGPSGIPTGAPEIKTEPVRKPKPLIMPVDSVDAPSPVTTETKSEIDIEPLSKTLIAGLVRERNKKQFSFFMIVNSLLALAIVAGVGWLVLRLNSEPPAIAQVAETETPKLFEQRPDGVEPSEKNALKGDASEPDNTQTPKKEDEVSPSPEKTPEASQPAVPPARPVFKYHSLKQVAEIWKLAKPGMVSLEIEGPLGKTRGVGTIVDSRGWIVTSHQAVKDAWKIEVTASINPLDQKTVDAPLQDIVRGHVISDPANDLAILAVNRRFVVSLADLKLGEHDRIVPESRLVAAAPPDQSFYHGVSEAKIEKRCPVSELPNEARSKIESWKIETNDKPWFQVLCPDNLSAGTPLFDAEGRYQAMVSFIKQDIAYAVAVDKVPALLKRATGTVSPLKSPGLKTESGDVVIVGSDHPVRQRMSKLSKLGAVCGDFGYLPANEKQVAELTEFLNEYQSARRYLKGKERDYRDAPENLAADDTLVELLKEWGQKVTASLQDLKLPGDERVKQFNAFAKNALVQKSALVPLLVRVDDGIFKMEEFRVEVLETDFVLSIPHSSKGRRLMPGTYWLLIVETSEENEEKKVNQRDGKSKALISVDLRAQFGPIVEQKQATK